MNTEPPLGPELTAFALNDPSLTEAQKKAIEQRLAVDPAARKLVEDTFFLGRHLTETLSAKAEPVEESPMGHTVAATLEKKRGKGMLPWWATALAACVAFCIGVLVKEGFTSNHAQVAPAIEKKQAVEVTIDNSASMDGKVAKGPAFNALDSNVQAGKVEPSGTSHEKPMPPPPPPITAPNTGVPTTNVQIVPFRYRAWSRR